MNSGEARVLLIMNKSNYPLEAGSASGIKDIRKPFCGRRYKSRHKSDLMNGSAY